MLQNLIVTILPPVISLCELIGIFIVVVTVIQAFHNYLRSWIKHDPSNAKFLLANGLATSLSFKMAAELLKTVIVHDFGELLMLGIVIVLRAMMAAMLHFEMKHTIAVIDDDGTPSHVDEMEVAAIGDLDFLPLEEDCNTTEMAEELPLVSK